MQTLRLYDPARRGAPWTDSLRPGQVVAFAKRIDSDVPCTPDGEPFATAESATCVVFDSLEEARDACEAGVQRTPMVRFDIFDHEGRTQPPLLTIVHSAYRESLDGSATAMRRRTRLAMALIVCGVPLMVFAYWISADRDPILPGFIGLNMVLIALRLFWMNLASREVERTRRERLARHGALASTAPAEVGERNFRRGEGGNEPVRTRPTP
jgi:hypothetical protein